jgi:hypothetical protein
MEYVKLCEIMYVTDVDELLILTYFVYLFVVILYNYI